MFKNLMKICVWWIVIFLAVFLISEIFFRIFRKENNPLAEIALQKSGFLFEPNHVMDQKSSKEGEFAYTARINNHGYRGRDFQMPKPEGIVRIFAVGDSFTFGVGAEDNETFPALIEEKLKSRHLPVEVVNAGIGHSSPIRDYVYLRDIHLKYQPDIVVLFFDLTDLADDWRTERNAVMDKNGEILRFDDTFMYGKRDGWVTMVKHSSFCRYIHNRMVRTFEKIRILGFKEYMKLAIQGKKAKAAIATSADINTQMDTIEYDGLLMMRGRDKKDQILKHWPRTEKYLSRIKNLLDQHHIPFLIVTYPHGIYVGPEEWSEGRKAWGFKQHQQYTDRFPFELVEDFAKKERIPFMNTLDDFLKAPAGKYFFTWGGHMTPAGNRIVARGIADSPVLRKMIEENIKK